jgi:solute carrier family 39 (zinc transporter), member 7
VISIVGDFIHNFTDGLSIGVSFVADFKMGLVTTMAMFFHEIPHEVGDFAILFQLKWTVWEIVGVQLMTGTAALIGSLVGSKLG